MLGIDAASHPLFPAGHQRATRAEIRRGLIELIVILAVMLVLYILLPLKGERRWVGAVVGLAAIIGTVPYTLYRVRAILKSEKPLILAVQALVALLTMLVLGFAAVYFFMAEGNPDNFLGLETKLDAVYFTVVTLGTVGFGDITPTSQAARGVVVAQIAVNFALLGISVRLLTMATKHRMEQPPTPSE
jgi:hypothetical protein